MATKRKKTADPAYDVLQRTRGFHPGPYFAHVDNVCSAVESGSHVIKTEDRQGYPFAIVTRGPDSHPETQRKQLHTAYLFQGSPELFQLAVLVLKGLKQGSIKAQPVWDMNPEAENWTPEALEDIASRALTRSLPPA
jgi:hypothetical protein